MNIRAAGLALAVALLPAITALAAPTPLPVPSGVLFSKVPITFANPGSGKLPPPANGQICIGPLANADMTNINPITGKLLGAPIISIPLFTSGESIAEATARTQNSHSCAHGRN
jgi:hypothetical protein